MNILILGASAFVAKGLDSCLRDVGHVVDCFYRNEVPSRDGSKVLGDVFKTTTSTCLKENYDVVINLVVIKDGDVEANLRYIDETLKLCEMKKAKKLIHFSSIMVYNYGLKKVDETTPIESLEETYKKGYCGAYSFNKSYHRHNFAQ